MLSPVYPTYTVYENEDTEQNYRRICNEFNGGNGTVDMRKMHNGGLVYPIHLNLPPLMA